MRRCDPFATGAYVAPVVDPIRASRSKRHLRTSGVNTASSKLCPSHFGQVEIAILCFLLLVDISTLFTKANGCQQARRYFRFWSIADID